MDTSGEREKQKVYREKQLLSRNALNLGFNLSKNVAWAMGSYRSIGFGQLVKACEMSSNHIRRISEDKQER